MLAVPTLLAAQGRPTGRVTLDDRLAIIEDRLASIENRLATLDEESRRVDTPDRLTLESEAKLDRLEVRVIQLEQESDGRTDGSIPERWIIDRIRSLERQVARLRDRAIR